MARWVSYIDNSVGDGANTIAGIISNGPTYGIGISSDVYITGLSTFGNTSRFTNTVRLDGQLRDGDNAFGSSGQVLSSDGTDTRWINAGDLAAGAASLVSVTNTTSGTGFLTFVDSTGGNEAIRTNSGIGYNVGTQVISGRISSIDNHNTGQLSEGSNLYFTQARARASLSGGTGLSYNSSTGQFSVQTLNQDTTGNAATATTLQTSRTIGGVSFNGSANINLPGVNQTGNQNTSGNAGSATVLETTRNFSISGEITANAQSFNGSGNVSLSATVDDNIIDEANLKISNSPTNGRFLQCNTGVSGGLTWAEVTVPAANTLSGTTLASGITASSITSVGTLTGLTVNGTVQVNNGNTIQLDTASGGLRGYIQATETNDAHLIIATSGGEDIAFKDGGTGGTTNMVIRGNGDVVVNSGTLTATNFSGNGSSVTSINASNISSGELNASRLPNHSAALLTSGTIPDARLDDSSLFVTGMILMYTGNSAPSGWAICNGSNGTPDLRDRFIVGAGSAYSVDDTGGAASVTLSTAQIPSHNHSFSGSSSHSHTINQHTHSFSGSGSNTHSHGVPKGRGGSQASISHHVADTAVEQTQGSFATTNTTISISVSGTTGGASDRGTDSQSVSISGNTGNKGDGGSHENRPPYYALMFIMKL